METPSINEVNRRMYAAIAEGRVDDAEHLLAEFPDLRERGGLGGTAVRDTMKAVRGTQYIIDAVRQ